MLVVAVEELITQEPGGTGGAGGGGNGGPGNDCYSSSSYSQFRRRWRRRRSSYIPVTVTEDTGGSGIVILSYSVASQTVFTFKSSTKWICPTAVTSVDYLVVAGGGGGGSDPAVLTTVEVVVLEVLEQEHRYQLLQVQNIPLPLVVVEQQAQLAVIRFFQPLLLMAVVVVVGLVVL